MPIVENQSTEPGLAIVFTEALRDEFERFGVLQIVESIKDADAVLNATILRVKQETQTVTASEETALQLSTVMTISSELRRVSGPMLWSNDRLQVSKTFGTSSDVVVTSSADFAGSNLGASDLAALDTREISRGQEREALTDLSEQAAKKIYNEAVAPDF